MRASATSALVHRHAAMEMSPTAAAAGAGVGTQTAALNSGPLFLLPRGASRLADKLRPESVWNFFDCLLLRTHVCVCIGVCRCPSGDCISVSQA